MAACMSENGSDKKLELIYYNFCSSYLLALRDLTDMCSQVTDRFLKVPFPSEREAAIALQSLSPDPEPRKGGITKNLDVSGQTLSVRWTADEARILRVSVSSFLDHLSLVMETMDAFGPPVSQ